MPGRFMARTDHVPSAATGAMTSSTGPGAPKKPGWATCTPTDVDRQPKPSRKSRVPAGPEVGVRVKPNAGATWASATGEVRVATEVAAVSRVMDHRFHVMER